MPFSLKNLTRLGKTLYPSLTWKLPSKEKILYLTFDDGPIPEVTPWVLSLLKKYNARSTFFCIGDNVEKNPEIFHRVLAEGHSVGNHTFNHLNGWKISTKDYLGNILLAEEAIYTTIDFRDSGLDLKSEKFPGRKLFRPPYGRITPSQIKQLKQLDYEIVMWDVVSMDFDRTIPVEKCLMNVTENAGPGSIIVFHDSLKAEKNLRNVLPEILEYYKKKGYKMDSL